MADKELIEEPGAGQSGLSTSAFAMSKRINSELQRKKLEANAQHRRN